MDSQTALSTKEKQDEDPFQSGGWKPPLVFSTSNFAVKRGRGGGDRWEGTRTGEIWAKVSLWGNFRGACRFCRPSWGVRGFQSVGAAGTARMGGGWRVERTSQIYVATNTLKERLRAA